MAERSITVRLKLNPTPFRRAAHNLGQTFEVMAAALGGGPLPPRRPYPRNCSLQTAREYRAARRAYGRALRAHRKALRLITSHHLPQEEPQP